MCTIKIALKLAFLTTQNKNEFIQSSFMEEVYQNANVCTSLLYWGMFSSLKNKHQYQLGLNKLQTKPVFTSHYQTDCIAAMDNAIIAGNVFRKPLERYCIETPIDGWNIYICHGFGLERTRGRFFVRVLTVWILSALLSTNLQDTLQFFGSVRRKQLERMLTMFHCSTFGDGRQLSLSHLHEDI